MRSEVQVFPGPPAFAGYASYGSASRIVAKAAASQLEERRRALRAKHSSSGYGAIAQLGERVLCKHEVVGSIPSGSTSLRWLRQLRLGEPIVAKPIVAKAAAS